MKRSKKTKQKRYEDPYEKQAIKYLSLISQKETGYLQDWAIINQIKQQDIQSSQETGNRRSDEQVTKEEEKEENSERNGIVLRVIKKKLNTTKGRQSSDDIKKREIEVRVQDFATIPNCRAIIRQRKSQLDMYKSHENDKQFHSLHKSYQEQNQQSENVIKIIEEEADDKLRQSKSLNYIDKIRKLSLPWVKQLPRQQKKQQPTIQQSQKAREQSRRLTELIKNKIRRKQSNKFIIQRHQQRQNIQKSTKDNETNMNETLTLHKNVENVEEILENNQIKILRSWLDNNRSKRKRSITSLLNQHFQYKYLEKKRNREKAMAMKSLKAIATMSHYNHMG